MFEGDQHVAQASEHVFLLLLSNQHHVLACRLGHEASVLFLTVGPPK
jgi:hypothetical protein